MRVHKRNAGDRSRVHHQQLKKDLSYRVHGQRGNDMTREEIKNEILKNIKETNSKRDSRFTAGKLAGMVQALKMVGILEDDDQMFWEIENEL